MDKEKTIPKKRGRKPKKKVVVEDTKNQSKITDNLIVKLNQFKEEISSIEPFNAEEKNMDEMQENKSGCECDALKDWSRFFCSGKS